MAGQYATYAEAAVEAVPLAAIHSFHFKELGQLIIIVSAILTKVIVSLHHGAGVNEVDAAVLSAFKDTLLPRAVGGN